MLPLKTLSWVYRVCVCVCRRPRQWSGHSMSVRKYDTFALICFANGTQGNGTPALSMEVITSWQQLSLGTRIGEGGSRYLVESSLFKVNFTQWKSERKQLTQADAFCVPSTCLMTLHTFTHLNLIAILPDECNSPQFTDEETIWGLEKWTNSPGARRLIRGRGTRIELGSVRL